MIRERQLRRRLTFHKEPAEKIIENYKKEQEEYLHKEEEKIKVEEECIKKELLSKKEERKGDKVKSCQNRH